jgi:ribose transport system substrate-binding protein
VVIVGQNGEQAGVDAVNDGRMTAMIDLVPWREALIAITMVQKLLQGQSVPRWVGTPVELYDKSNISQRIDWDKAVSDIKAGTLSCAQGGGCPAL